MSQQTYQLKMVYHRKSDGLLALLKSQGQTFGFSDDSSLVYFLSILAGVPGITPIVRNESVMVDNRFPIIIDPDRVHIHSLVADAREMTK